jgi:hypothetical protein
MQKLISQFCGRLKFFSLLQIWVLAFVGCTSQCGYLKTSVIDLNLTAGDLTLVTPLSSPADNQRPTFKVSGVKDGTTITLYADANCQTEVGSAVANGSEGIISVLVNLSEGTHSFTSKATRQDAESSPCSLSFSYIVDLQSPIISSVSPNQVTITGDALITIRGSHFVSEMNVYVGNLPCSNVNLIDGSSLTCLVSPMNEAKIDLSIIKKSGGTGALPEAIEFVAALPTAPVCFDGPVNSLVTETTPAPSSRRIFVGGLFNQLGRCSGGFAPIGTATGLLSPTSGSFAQVEGYVNTIISDGGAGYFIGGKFRRVGGLARVGVAHILSDFSLDQSFINPITSIDGEVKALAYYNNRLFVGGDFNVVNGSSHKSLLIIESDGALNPWDPGIVSGSSYSSVNALLVANKKLFLAGKFDMVNNLYHGNLASFSILQTPSLDSVTLPIVYGHINSMAILANNLYLGGSFTQLLDSSSGTINRNHLSSVDLANGHVVSSWNPNASAEVFALTLSGTDLFAAGMFSSIGGIPRFGVAQISTGTSAVVSGWGIANDNITDSNYYTAITFDNNSVYMGGKFTNIKGESRFNLASFDKVTGAMNKSWNPKLNNRVNTLMLVNGTLLAGGNFTAVGSKIVSNLAALSEASGSAVNFDFQTDGPVNALYLNGPSLYVGGKFGAIGKTPKNSIAEINLSDRGDALTNWDPSLNLGVSFGTASATVNSISTKSGNQIIIGGHFTHMGGRPGSGSLTSVSHNILLLDANGGAYVPGSFGGAGVGADGIVHSIKKSGNSIIISGEFLKIENANHQALAVYIANAGAISLAGSNPLSGNAKVYDSVFGTNNSLFLCGGLVGGGTECIHNSDYGSTSPTVTDWGPAMASGEIISAMFNFTSAGRIFLGGKFSHSGAENLMIFTDRLDPTITTPVWSGKLYSRLNYNGVKVMLQSSDGNMLYVGGGFDLVDDKSRSGLVRYNLSTMEVTEP